MRPLQLLTRYPWFRAAVVAAGATMLVAGGGLREDELTCEEAVAHLQECCPDFADAQIACQYSTTCGLTEPALSISESRCIRDLPCTEIQARDLCDRTRDLPSPHDDGDGKGLVSHPPVCP